MINIKNYKTAPALLATAAVAAVLVAGTVTIGSEHFVLAEKMNNNDTGIYVPTNSNQMQVCKTFGNNSPISGTSPASCSASSSSAVTQSGGDTSAVAQGAITKTTTPSPTIEFLTFVECSGTNGNHNVHCTVHDFGITDINCIVANPAISGGNNVGDCQTNNGVHLTCVIPPQPGVFPCSRP